MKQVLAKPSASRAAARVSRVPRTPKSAAAKVGEIDRHLNHELFQALSDPTRLRLLACLTKCARPCSVSEAAECCAVDLSVVSRHLALMHRAGLLQASKQGRTVSYSVRAGELSAFLRALADAIDSCISCAPGSRACGKPGCCPSGQSGCNCG